MCSSDLLQHGLEKKFASAFRRALFCTRKIRPREDGLVTMLVIVRMAVVFVAVLFPAFPREVGENEESDNDGD